MVVAHLFTAMVITTLVLLFMARAPVALPWSVWASVEIMAGLVSVGGLRIGSGV